MQSIYTSKIKALTDVEWLKLSDQLLQVVKDEIKKNEGINVKVKFQKIETTFARY